MTFLSAAVRLEGGKEIVLHEEDLEGESPSPCQGVWEMGGAGRREQGALSKLRGRKAGQKEGWKQESQRGHAVGIAVFTGGPLRRPFWDRREETKLSPGLGDRLVSGVFLTHSTPRAGFGICLSKIFISNSLTKWIESHRSHNVPNEFHEYFLIFLPEIPRKRGLLRRRTQHY